MFIVQKTKPDEGCDRPSDPALSRVASTAMNRSIVSSPRKPAALVLVFALLLSCIGTSTLDAQKQRGLPLNKGGMREALHPTLVRPPISEAWKDPEALKRGEEMLGRLIESAGGWDAYMKLGGFRYDLLNRSKMNTGKGKNPWRVHHYEPRLVHLNTEASGYIYAEFAKPSLTGPDFQREVKFGEIAWREVRGNYTRTPKGERTATTSVRMERFTGTMPFSLRSMNCKMAFMREEKSEVGTLEMYAVQMSKVMMLNYYPWMVEEYGIVDEFHLLVDPAENRVVQLQFNFPDDTVRKAPYLRWWTMDFEGAIKLGENCVLPHKRFRWLSGWNEITEMWMEDVVVERISPKALRRPWQADGVYAMTIRCDFWDPPKGVDGLTGHGTGIEVLRPGAYPPNHPKNAGVLPPEESEGTDAADGEAEAGTEGGADAGVESGS
ncbi:MAG: hypothetical protein ACI8TQ_000120 [Planctomycetota bacterium]|jgi:hypothetical protein